MSTIGKGRRYDQGYKDMIVELFKVRNEFIRVSSVSISLQNKQLVVRLKI